MAHVRLPNRHGTVAEFANNAPGYTQSGVGEHSRKLASGAPFKADGFADQTKPQRWRTTAEQIKRVTRELKKVKTKLTSTLSHERRAFLESNVEIKTKFLAQLKAEQAGMLQ